MLTADARARTLFLASDMLAKQLHALRLPEADAGQVLPLIDLIQHHAQALSGQEAPSESSERHGQFVRHEFFGANLYEHLAPVREGRSECHPGVGRTTGRRGLHSDRRGSIRLGGKLHYRPVYCRAPRRL